MATVSSVHAVNEQTMGVPYPYTDERSGWWLKRQIVDKYKLCERVHAAVSARRPSDTVSLHEYPDIVEIYRTSHEVCRGLHFTTTRSDLPGARVRRRLLQEVRLGHGCVRRVDGAYRSRRARNAADRRLRR